MLLSLQVFCFLKCPASGEAGNEQSVLVHRQKQLLVPRVKQPKRQLLKHLGVLARKRCCGGLVDQPDELSVGWANQF